MAKVPCKSNEYIRNVDIHNNDNNDSATESWRNIMNYNLWSQKSHLPVWNCKQKECKGDAKEDEGHFHINCIENISSAPRGKVIFIFTDLAYYGYNYMFWKK